MSGKIKDNQNWSPASLNHAMQPSLIEAIKVKKSDTPS